MKIKIYKNKAGDYKLKEKKTAFKFTENQPDGYSADRAINFPDTAKIDGSNNGVAIDDDSAGCSKE